MSVITAPSILNDVSLDAEPACQFPDGCSRSADLAVRAFCGCMLLLCQPCYTTLVRKLREYEQDRGGFAECRCSICGTDDYFYSPVVPQVFVSVVSL